jgi:protein-tyrosine-phosphatase
MAEAVLRAELDRAGLSGQVEVDSAGTGDWHVGGPMDPRARAELHRRGYDGSGHRARQFDPSWFGRYDLVLAMDGGNLARLRRMAPDREATDRTLLFRSFDPAPAGRGELGAQHRLGHRRPADIAQADQAHPVGGGGIAGRRQRHRERLGRPGRGRLGRGRLGRAEVQSSDLQTRLSVS